MISKYEDITLSRKEQKHEDAGKVSMITNGTHTIYEKKNL